MPADPVPPREITLNLDDPDLRARLRRVLSSTDPGSLVIAELVDRIIREFASPEPSEPPPGVYRDDAGDVFLGNKASQWLIAGGIKGWMPWAEASLCVQGELVPLFSVDELIPDPDDETSVVALGDEAANGYSFNPCTVEGVLRVLRARAVSRG